MKPLLRAGIAVFAGAVVSAGCVVSVDSQGQIVREEKRFLLDGVPDVHVRTFDGAIEVRSWERREVVVEIEKRGPTKEAVDALHVESSRDGNRINVEVKGPKNESFSGFGFHVSTSAKLTVNVPRRVDVNARTGDGSIRAEGLTGRLELRTGDGSIRVTNVSGELLFNTGDGSVVVDRAEGRLVLETGDGGVSVEGKLSAVKIHTGDGSIVYRAEPDGAMTDDWDISTGDGSVTLHLPESFAAELDAHTGDGRIRGDLDIVTDRSGRDEERRTLRGRIGNGGRRLKIRTGDGSITLRNR